MKYPPTSPHASSQTDASGMRGIKGKVAVVTGSGRGIGKAIALRLGDEGASVMVNCRESADEAEAVAREIREGGREAAALRADISNPGETRTMMQEAAQRFGGIDILCSNAGVEHFGRLEEITQEDFWRVFSVNVGAQLFAVQAASPYLGEGGRVVLTSSVSARIAVFYHALYAASKGAVSAMAFNLAPELGERSITINAIAPGGTATDMASEHGGNYTHPALRDVPPEKIQRSMTSLGRIAEPEEVAGVVAFLVSRDASYITGSTVNVDGGRI